MPGAFESIFGVQLADAASVEINWLLVCLGLEDVFEKMKICKSQFELLDHAIKSALHGRVKATDKQL